MSRASQNTNIDAALATIATNAAEWIAAGGRADLLVKTVNTSIAAADPAIARVVQRRLGSSFMAGSATTLTAADVTP